MLKISIKSTNKTKQNITNFILKNATYKVMEDDPSLHMYGTLLFRFNIVYFRLTVNNTILRISRFDHQVILSDTVRHLFISFKTDV